MKYSNTFFLISQLWLLASWFIESIFGTIMMMLVSLSMFVGYVIIQKSERESDAINTDFEWSKHGDIVKRLDSISKLLEKRNKKK